jgi:hypothetical protein
VKESRRVRTGIGFDGLAFWSFGVSHPSRLAVVLGLPVLAGVIGSGESMKAADAGAVDSFCGVYE